MLKAKYGPPTVTEEFWEERAWNRRLAWRRAGEVLVLQCFRLKGIAAGDAKVIGHRPNDQILVFTVY